MSNVAVLFQFRRAFPQERVGSDCAILNRQFQKTAFSVSIPTGHCRGLRVLLPTEDGFPISIPSWQFPKTAFPVSIPSRQFQKTAVPVSIPSRQFQKTAFPVSIPSRQFQKGAMRGQKKRGVCKGAWPFFTKKGLKVAVFVQFRRTFPRKKSLFDSCVSLQRVGLRNSQPAVSKNGFFSFNSQAAVRRLAAGAMRGKKKGCLQGRLAIFHQKRAKSGSFFVQFRRIPTKKKRYSTAAFPGKGSDCAIPSRQFQKTAFSVSIPTKHCSSLRVCLPTRLVFPVSISGRQFQKTVFPVSIPSRQFQKTAF